MTIALVVLGLLTLGLAEPGYTHDVTVQKIIKRPRFGQPGHFADVPLFTDFHWQIQITVMNNSGSPITNVVMRDRFSADLELGGGPPGYAGAILFLTAGCGSVTIAPTSPQVPGGNTTVTWNIGTMADGKTCVLVLDVSTDINPAGHQEYTSVGRHCLNSGPTLKFLNAAGHRESREGGPLCVTTEGV